MNLHALSFLAALTATALPAQCLFTSVTAQSIGASCNVPSTGFCAIVAVPASLHFALDVPNCSLEVDVNAFSGCGASVPLRVLVFGTQPAAVPLPEFGSDCFLHLLPIAFLTTTTTSFTLALPPNVPALSFLVQGAALSTFVSPGPGTTTLAFTDGVSVSLQ
jgi:hypothetical protein